MSSAIEPGRGAKLGAMLGVPLGGGVLGALAGYAVAADSELGVAASAAMLPLAFFAGLGLWLKVALMAAGARLVGGLLRRHTPSGPAPSDASLPPGAVMLLLTSVGMSLAAGGLVSLLSRAATVGRTLGLYGLLGTAYGLVAWRMARRGYLQPFDEA